MIFKFKFNKAFTVQLLSLLVQSKFLDQNHLDKHKTKKLVFKLKY